MLHYWLDKTIALRGEDHSSSSQKMIEVPALYLAALERTRKIHYAADKGRDHLYLAAQALILFLAVLCIIAGKKPRTAPVPPTG